MKDSVEFLTKVQSIFESFKACDETKCDKEELASTLIQITSTSQGLFRSCSAEFFSLMASDSKQTGRSIEPVLTDYCMTLSSFYLQKFQ
jgi:hypothetical protein